MVLQRDMKLENAAYVQIDHVVGAFYARDQSADDKATKDYQPTAHDRTTSWIQVIPAPDVIKVTVSAVYTLKEPILNAPYINWAWIVSNPNYTPQKLGPDMSVTLSLKPTLGLNEVSTLFLEFRDGNTGANINNPNDRFLDRLRMVIHADDYFKLAKDQIDKGLEHLKR